MPRFASWLAIGLAAAFLVVASASFAPSAIVWLAFAISIGTLFVSAGVAYRYRESVPTLVMGLAATLVSAWTIVASLVFSHATVEDLALASSLAISGLAIAGLTAHELTNDRALRAVANAPGERRPRPAAAA